MNYPAFPSPGSRHRPGPVRHVSRAPSGGRLHCPSADGEDEDPGDAAEATAEPLGTRGALLVSPLWSFRLYVCLSLALSVSVVVSVSLRLSVLWL